ncbi:MULTISPECIES: T9SS type A sorting domain-containing protein [Mesoflavibacter]|uniref:T9SS type A sorting domain-containing protein n=1 Tax=Mesoflavibacter TaxID=444051 RepID=UPI000D0FA1A6|nr:MULTISPECIES: T9SS type A sorting domain-containing protein [Mesoflavibacter]QIJ88372.1 hypothetical protein C7H62_0563 [Mesoflavibacter sp. HG96]QIJ91100.1 hypothetical protein C7H56_0563 [Mesoflavibacter sp. HG37]
MKKTTRKNLSKKIAKYGALSIAIAGVAEANGQIIYTDIDPDFVGNDSNIGLDLDNDTNFDFVIIDDAAPAVAIVAYNSTTGNSFVGSQPSYIYPFALNAGDPISAGQTAWYGGSNVGTLNYVSCYNGIGGSNWCGVTDKYLGLRFQIAGQTHYGWARLDVTASGDSYTLKDYAYESTPNTAINAGDLPLSVDEFANEKEIKIVALNKSIGLYNLPNEVIEYKLYSISGKKVLEGSVNDHTSVIEAKNVSSGLYIIELKNTINNSVIRKKVIL